MNFEQWYKLMGWMENLPRHNNYRKNISKETWNGCKKEVLKIIRQYKYQSEYDQHDLMKEIEKL